MATTTVASVEQRIEEAAGGIVGVQMGLLEVRRQFGRNGDRVINLFLDTVPERGEALWLKFKESVKTGEDLDFVRFAVNAITPKLLGK